MERAAKSTFSALGGVAVKVFAGATAAVSTGVAGFAALSKSALDAVGDFEQLKGGIETLFGAQGTQSVEEYAQLVGKSVDEVQDEYKALMETQEAALENADKAYKTAGLSANAYMETVTSFAASLKQSLGDEKAWQLADYADKAVIDMSDNANKMGTNMESIQNAYQGFAKQNYTMLDNLKLGYGGTKEEMQRLLADAEKLAGYKAGTFDVSNFADIVDAIHIVQDELGITGTTAKEAATTIQGSVSSMKASWENFLTGSGSVDELVDSVSTAAGVIVDNLGEIIPRLAQTLPKLISKVGKMLPDLLEQLLPSLIEGATALVQGFVTVLPVLIETMLPSLIDGVISVVTMMVEELPSILSAFSEVIPMLIEAVMTMLPLLIEAGIQIVQQLALGILEELPSILSSLSEVIPMMIEAIMTMLPLLIETGGQILLQLATGIVQELPSILESLRELIPMMVDAVMAMLPQILEAGIQIIIQLAQGIAQALPDLIPQIVDVVLTIVEVLLDNIDLIIDAGIELIIGLAVGLVSAVPRLIERIPEIFTKLVQAIISNAPKLSEAVGQLTEMIIQMLPGIIEAIINGLMALGASLWDKVLYPAYTKFSDWALEIVEKGKEAASAFIEKVVEFIQNLPETVAYWLGYVCVKTALWTQEMIAKAAAAGSMFVQKIVDFIKNLPSKVMEWLTSVITKVVSFKLQLTNKAGEAGKSFCDKITNALRDLPKTMANIGRNIVTGIWNGISSGWSWLVDGVKNLANSLFDGAKAALGIHSPSRKFKWIGEMCVAGMDEPLEEYDPYETLNKSMALNTGSLRAEFAGAYTGLSAAGAYIDYDRMGQEMKMAIDGMSVTIDGRKAGQMMAQPVNDALGRINQRRT